MEEMKAAEAQGKFRYVPKETVNSDDILVEEKEKPLVPPSRAEPPLQSLPKAMPPPIIPTPSAAPLIPTPSAATPIRPPVVVSAPPPIQKPASMLSDEFLDPELDLELEGMNLDGDDEVRNLVMPFSELY